MKKTINFQTNIKMYSNNFDLIRLFAASQVFLHHLYNILGVNFGSMVNGVSHFLVLFPGVPIFYFISGFLISQSFENSGSIKSYFVKRFLRIYPALIASVFLGVLLILASGYQSEQPVTLLDWTILIFSKVTIFQFYNPDFLRAYGDGVFNGNLWTITVELQFYIVIVIVLLIKKNFFLKGAYFWPIILAVFLLCNMLYLYLFPYHKEDIWFKLIGVSFVPWFYMFLVGTIVQQYNHLILRYVKKYSALTISIYIIFAYLGLHFRIFDYGNHIHPILAFPLFASILCFAYTFPFLSQYFIKGQDISYGIYLYHMLIINFFIFHYGSDAKHYSILIIGIVFTAAIISWFFLEKHAIKLKDRLA
jgi:peptidoglycan/LPS O-acetylase OafA/YrhL